MNARIARRALLLAVVVGTAVGMSTVAPTGAVTVGPTRIFGVGGIHHDGAVLGVSCTAGGCVAVGTNEGSQMPLVITGVPTTPVAAYADADPGRHFLADVWCATPSSCVAGGVADSATGNHQYITTYADGTWTRVAPVDPPDINPSGGYGTHLVDVSCTDVDNCVAVGAYQTNSGATPANGVRAVAYTEIAGTWSVQVLEPAGSVVDTRTNPPTAQLTSVRCISTTTCVAVGTYGIGAGASVRPYLAVGTVSGATMTWATRDIPIADFQSNASGFDSVWQALGVDPLLDCSTPTDCVVAGTYVSTSASAVKTYFWPLTDGTWASEAATYATDPSDPNVVRALACPSANRCYAVGNTFSGAHGSVVTLDHGVPSLTFVDKPGNQTNWLTTIACPTTSNCGIAGYGNVLGGQFHVTIGAREAGSWAMSAAFAEIPDEYDAYLTASNNLSCEPDGTCVLGASNRNSEYNATLTTFTIVLDPPVDDGGDAVPPSPNFTG